MVTILPWFPCGCDKITYLWNETTLKPVSVSSTAAWKRSNGVFSISFPLPRPGRRSNKDKKKVRSVNAKIQFPLFQKVGSSQNLFDDKMENVSSTKRRRLICYSDADVQWGGDPPPPPCWTSTYKLIPCETVCEMIALGQITNFNKIFIFLLSTSWVWSRRILVIFEQFLNFSISTDMGSLGILQ